MEHKMIYIVGHSFHFNPKPAVSSSAPLQEQMALNKARASGMPSKPHNPFDQRFTAGHQYKIASIQKVTITPSEYKLKYLFADVTSPHNPDIDILVSDSGKGDEYVASISGAIQQLNAERSAINSNFSGATEF